MEWFVQPICGIIWGWFIIVLPTNQPTIWMVYSLCCIRPISSEIGMVYSWVSHRNGDKMGYDNVWHTLQNVIICDIWPAISAMGLSKPEFIYHPNGVSNTNKWQ